MFHQTSISSTMASPPSPSLLFFLSLLSLLSLSSSTTITLPLKLINTNLPSQSQYQKLNYLASLSQTRARHLKTPKPQQSSNTQLFPRSYGGYSISLNIGTPPQTIPFVMDTGSELVWLPCTHRYTCRNCTFAATQPPTVFIPKQSSTSKLVGCLNKKCGWVHTSLDVRTRCGQCVKNINNCSQICPPYFITYGSGSTSGLSIVDSLNLPGKNVPDFLVGCSVTSSRQPAGIAGFGRGPASLPNQLGLKKFSYCLLSHKFDDSPESSSLVLYSGKDSDQKTSKLSYTPILKLPEIQDKQVYTTFSTYYYLGLRKITIGGKKIKIPFKYLTPGPTGDGGTIVDSGSTFTFLTKYVHELVVSALVEQVKDYKRAKQVETVTGLSPCFNISGHRSVNFPEMKFHFKGGAEMLLPTANYFSFLSEEVVCLTMVTDAGDSGGPAIVLGNFQLQNFYTEFDLGNERFGFRQQLCL